MAELMFSWIENLKDLSFKSQHKMEKPKKSRVGAVQLLAH